MADETVERVDGITVEVVHQAFRSVAEQMRRTLIRTSFNPGIYEVLDFGISIYDAKPRLLAEAIGIAAFLGANDEALRNGLQHAGRDNLRPGDVILLNYPYWSGAHTYDAVVYAPVFYPEVGSTIEPELVGFLTIRAHWVDLNAKDAGYVLDSTSIHQEGLIFPCTKVVKEYRLDEELVDLIRYNTRVPEIVIGDLHSQLFALHVGELGVQDIYRKFGKHSVCSAMDQVIEHAERTSRRAVASLPNGSWTSTDYVDDDGVSEDLVRMTVVVSITDSEFTVDFSGSQEQVTGPVNLPYGATVAAAKLLFKAITSPNQPSSEGQFAPLRVIAPPGSLYHAVYPAATFTLWSGLLTVEVIRGAVAKVLPELGAASAGETPGFIVVVRDDRTGRPFVSFDLEGIGWGGTPTHDGATAQQNPSEMVGRNASMEVMEQSTGLVHEVMELRMDSGGPGRYRGGLGIRRVVRASRSAEILSMKKKTLTSPQGLQGGREGLSSGFVVYPGTPRERRLRMQRAALAVGDRFENLSGGGGGFGDPLARPSELVVEDVLEGYVSEASAREIYGVAVRDGQVVGISEERRVAARERRGTTHVK